jgi:hypothetical protein
MSLLPLTSLPPMSKSALLSGEVCQDQNEADTKLKIKRIVNLEDYVRLDEHNTMKKKKSVTDLLSKILNKKIKKGSKNSTEKDVMLTVTDLFQVHKASTVKKREDSLFIPHSIHENSLKPYELYTIGSTRLNTNSSKNVKGIERHKDHTASENKSYIDGFLESIDSVSKKKDRIKDDKKHTNKFLSRKVVVLRDTVINKKFEHEDELLRINTLRLVSDIICMLMLNLVLEKTIKMTNIDIDELAGIDNKSIWFTRETIVYPIAKAVLLENTSIKTRGSHKESPLKDEFLTYISELLASADSFPDILSVFDPLSMNATLLDKKLEEFEIAKKIINHQFVFYCVVDDKIQLYKLVITALSEEKISYKLYQIESIQEDKIKHIHVTNRQLVISRDITNKFTGCAEGTSVCSKGTTGCAEGTSVCSKGTTGCAEGTSVCSKGTTGCAEGTTGKYVINKKKLTFSVSIIDLRLNYTNFLRRLNNCAHNWALLLNVILYDATRCVRAFIKNIEKTKIAFEPSEVKIQNIKNILIEVDETDFDVKGIVKYQDNSLENLVRNMNHIHQIEFSDEIIDREEYNLKTLIRYPDSKIYKLYHPLYHLCKIAKSKIFLSENDFKKTITEYTGPMDATSNLIIVSHIKSHKFITDLKFVEFNGKYYLINRRFGYNMYDFGVIDGTYATNLHFISIVTNLIIESNCRIILYHRFGDVCQIISEGKKNIIRIANEIVLYNMFIKIDPDSLEDLIRESDEFGILPYIKMSFTRYITKTESNNPVFETLKKGSITEVEHIENDTISHHKSFLQLDLNNTFSTEKVSRIKYFGEIRDSQHLQAIESDENIKMHLTFD